MNKDTKVICGFPGCGKTHYFNKNNKYKSILDSDSSLFSWIYDENGNRTNEKDPDFPNNYIKHIEYNIGKVDIIFISTHKSVREALATNKICHYIVIPNDTNNIKDVWIDRYINRGDTDDFISLMNDSFSSFIKDIWATTGWYGIIIPLDVNLYMEDAVNYIYEK